MKRVHLLPEKIFLPLKDSLRLLRSMKRGFHFQVIRSGTSFKSSFTSKNTLVSTFSETRGPSSKKYVVLQGIIMPKLLQTFQCFWSHSTLLALEKYS